MKTRSPAFARCPATTRRGFALLLVLGLLAFLMAVGLALSLMVRVEGQVGDVASSAAQARENARLGLQVALSELQRWAGPDRRVSARAEWWEGTRPSQRYWTGIWGDPQRSPVWLVSAADEPDPRFESTRSRVRLVGAQSATPAAAWIEGERVPLRVRTPPAGDVETALSGHYAYWVGDEGVKPSVLAFDDRTAAFGAPMEGRRLDVEGYFPGFQPGAPGQAQRFAPVLLPSQLLYPEGTPFTLARWRQSYHHVALQTLAVMTDPVAGGLKRDRAAADGMTAARFFDGEGSWLDRCFLSDFPAGESAPEGWLPPPLAFFAPAGERKRLETGRPDSAAHLWVVGALNLNTLDPSAWRALWGALPAVVREGEGPPRVLSEREKDLLADHFTPARLRAAYPGTGKQSGEPFRSLADFVHSGLVADALAAAGLGEGSPDEETPPLSPIEVLTQWAPILAVRSDTFVIRAYGDVVNPATQRVEARAWCEAWVQRLPAYVDPADPPGRPPAELTREDNRALGRRFQMIGFRWLTPHDL